MADPCGRVGEGVYGGPATGVAVKAAGSHMADFAVQVPNPGAEKHTRGPAKGEVVGVLDSYMADCNLSPEPRVFPTRVQLPYYCTRPGPRSGICESHWHVIGI